MPDLARYFRPLTRFTNDIFQCSLSHETGQLAPFPAKTATLRVRRFRGNARHFQAPAVDHGRVPAAMPDNGGLQRNRLVQVMAVDRPLLTQFRIVVLVTDYPLAGRRHGSLGMHCGLDFSNAAEVHISARDLAHAIGVAVRIDESGRYRGSGAVVDTGTRPFQGLEFTVRSDGQDTVAHDRDGLCQRPRAVHRVDPRTLDEQVGIYGPVAIRRL